MLPNVKTVKVGVVAGFFRLVALWLGQPPDDLTFQLHGDVAWQHRQQEPLLCQMKHTEKGVNVREAKQGGTFRDSKPPDFCRSETTGMCSESVKKKAVFARWVVFHLFVCPQ